jgi:hypothetical protein
VQALKEIDRPKLLVCTERFSDMAQKLDAFGLRFRRSSLCEKDSGYAGSLGPLAASNICNCD